VQRARRKESPPLREWHSGCFLALWRDGDDSAVQGPGQSARRRRGPCLMCHRRDGGPSWFWSRNGRRRAPAAVPRDIGAGVRVRLAGHDARPTCSPSLRSSPSRDGIPNVIIEAMASGLPVMTTTAEGIPELVTPSVDGLLVARPHDVEGIVASIAALLEDPALRMRVGLAGRATVEQRFDLRSAEELATLFGVAPRRAGCAFSV
jgi:hypothetical protein